MPDQIKVLIVEDQDHAGSVISKSANRRVLTEVITADQVADVGLSATGQSFQYQEKAYDRMLVVRSSRWVPNFAINQLEASDTVIALSDLEKWQPRVEANQQILFLNGLFHESHPAVSKRVMQAALKLQDDFGAKGFKTLIFTHNLKVSGDGLEALYQDCKKAGVHFAKFTQTRPQIEQNVKGEVTVRFADEASGQEFYLKPDLTVVDESVETPRGVYPLADALRLEKDAQGFLQADNVHRLPVDTNHRAVWVADAVRGLLMPEETVADRANAALAPFLDALETVDPFNAAVINPNHCIRCLTCYRACPHGAVVMAPHPVINAEWCQSCGICPAECPQHAIQMIAADEIRDSIILPEPANATPSRRIIVFGCARSAAPSAELACLEGHTMDLTYQLVEVPCAGALSSEHLLKGIAQDVEGVLIVTCHLDNCNAGSGNCLAHDRVEALRPVLDQVGFDTQRIAITTLANNMGAGFTAAVNRFARRLSDL